ncbi:PspC domain-containing protein [Nocardioides sp. DS6]|uniref:PspC domain-containing protein n=1 Tax=Nocardioides eburneus TaxID=3231482 RepID=A0ABV3T1J4_9ACTN
MTTTPTDPPSPGSGGGPGGTGTPGPSGPHVSAEEARDLSRLRRTVHGSPEGRHIAGVAGGLARHLDIDPIIVRVGLVVLVFFGGAGLLLYAVGWLFVPEEGREQAVIKVDPRGRSLVLYVTGGIALLAILGDTVGRFHLPWPLIVVALVVLVLLTRREGAWTRLGRSGEQAGDPGGTRPAAPWPTDPVAPAPYAGRVDLSKDATAHGPAPAGPAPVPPPTWVRPPDPRRRGPLLFLPTLCLIALADGLLGVVDVAGADIAGPAYPALALGVIGAMLVLGSLWGRAGGLIALGLIGTLVLAGSAAAHEWDLHDSNRTLHPATAAQVPADYDFNVGEVVLDLTSVADLEALDGRTLRLDGDMGRIRVIVPDELTVEAHGHVGGPGNVRLFDEGRGGIDNTLDHVRPGTAGDAPEITIDADLSVGSIEVVDEDHATRSDRLGERSTR